jgi:hypothetical protein
MIIDQTSARRYRGSRIVLHAIKATEVNDVRGLSLTPTAVGRSLQAYDLLVVPGGMGTTTLQHHKPFIDWLRSTEPIRIKNALPVPRHAPVSPYKWTIQTSGNKPDNEPLSGCCPARRDVFQIAFMACVPCVIAPPARNAAATSTASAIS